MVALLKKRLQQGGIFGMKQAAKARVKVGSLVSKEIHTTGAFHCQRLVPVRGANLYGERKEKILGPARITGSNILYMQRWEYCSMGQI